MKFIQKFFPKPTQEPIPQRVSVDVVSAADALGLG